eukprot:gene3588-3833_t
MKSAFICVVFGVIVAFVHGYQVNSLSMKASRSLELAAKSKSVPFLEEPKNLNKVVGSRGFDPLGFSDVLDVRYLREAELKHCRIAMLATVGFIATDFFHLPGDIHAISSVAAHNAAVSSGALFQVLALVIALEAINVVAIRDMLNGSGRQPGEFYFDPLGFYNGKSDKVKEDLQLKELENGRLAMLAFSGIVTQAVVTGKGFPYF